MRKPRDYAADLKALNDKARQLQERKVRDLGQLVVATGADVLPAEHLAGALPAAAGNTNLVTMEEWRQRGAGFFQNTRRKAGAGDSDNANGAAGNYGEAASSGGSTGAS